MIEITITHNHQIVYKGVLALELTPPLTPSDILTLVHEPKYVRLRSICRTYPNAQVKINTCQ